MKVITETKSESGSPNPRLEAKDGETAGTESEHGKLIVCPPDAALRDCAGCRIMAECKADIRAYQAQMHGIIDAEESNRALQLVAQLKQKRIHDEITSIQRAHGLVGRGL